MSSRVTPHFIRGPVALSHLILTRFIQSGDTVIDATCGNGNDTLLLAELAGDTGTVWAFDIQAEAIRATSQKLEQAGRAGHVMLIHGGHEQLSNYVTGNVAAVVFNLGYLPGGDRSLVTRPETTLSAFDQSMKLMRPGGILAITVYPGHDGGAGERGSVDAWAMGLDPRQFHVWQMGQMNVPADAPYFIFVQKAA